MRQWAAEEARREIHHWQAPHGLPDQDTADIDHAVDGDVTSFQDIKWSMLGPCRFLRHGFGASLQAFFQHMHALTLTKLAFATC